MTIPLEDYKEEYFGEGVDENGDTPIYGYSTYEREPRCFADECPNSGGNGICGHEHFRTIALKLVHEFNLKEKKVLELGCAKGFVVEDLVSVGVNAYGVDCSEFAIERASPSIASRLKVADATEYIKSLPNNSFQFIIGLRFLPCISDEKLPELMSELKRVAKNGYFTIDPLGTYQYDGHYNQKSMEDWLAMTPEGYIFVQQKWHS